MNAFGLAAEAPDIALGVDLGGTRVRAALVTAGGRVLRRAEERTEALGGPARILSQIEDLAGRLIDGTRTPCLKGIGVSLPGPIDTVAGIAMEIPTLPGFAGVPLKAELEKRFAFPVRLENDGIAAAIGEWRFGAGRGLENLVYVTVSTGLGGGVIADDRVLRGRMGMAGHIGHMAFVPDGLSCPCGNRGCFEAYGSGTAFARRARTAARRHGKSLLGGHGAGIDSRSVFAAARNGDPLAGRLVDEEAEILGRGFVSLLHVFSPDILIMGGGLSHEFSRLLPGIQRYIARRAMPAFREVKLVRAALGQNSGLIGAAALTLPEPLRPE